MFRLDFSCKDCNIIHLNQVIDHVQEAWDCIENGSTGDEDRFLDLNGYDCDTVAVDTIIYWNGNNTADVQQYINSNFDSSEELIAVVDHPEYEDEGYEYIDNYPIFAPNGYRWKKIYLGDFRVLERHLLTYWTTTFIVVDDDYELPKGNSLREIRE